jgi:type 2 lantibiotic biosynthesis protein LanM
VPERIGDPDAAAAPDARPSHRPASRSGTVTAPGDASSFRADLSRAAVRALPLAMRGRPPRVEAAGRPRAQRILDRWRRQPPFDTAGWFAQRLAADGLTEDHLLALLAEPPHLLAERITAPQRWVDPLVDAFESPAPPLDVPAEHAFATLVAPLLAAAGERLRDGVAALVAEGSGGKALGDPDRIVAQLMPSLTGAAHVLAARTMLLELNVARVSGVLRGASPADRFAEFVASLADPRRATELLVEYPVLARQLVVAAEQWVAANLLLLRRLASDLPAIRETFAGSTRPAAVSEIEVGLGDAHRCGQSVARVRFSDGLRVLYKPRPIEVDAHFQELVRWLNRSLRWPLLELRCLPRAGYGWVEHVDARPCESDDELRRFYHRAGALLAVHYLLGGTDLHGHNLIAVGDQPVAIDHETLFQPRPRTSIPGLTASEWLAYDTCARSVLRVGMLPSRTLLDRGRDGADQSALGWRPDALSAREAPTILGAGTDEARVGYAYPTLGDAVSRPRPGAEPLRLSDYAADIDAGFVTTYDLLVDHKLEVRRLLRAFAGDHTRVVRRDTLEYQSLLSSANHPDFTGDGLARDQRLDQLWNLAALDASLLPFIPHERADLWNNDIPLFTTRTDSTMVWGSSGRPVGRASRQSGLDAALDTLDRLGPDDLRWQRYLCRMAIALSASGANAAPDAVSATASAMAGGGSERGKPAGPAVDAPAPPALSARAVERAVRIGERLVGSGYAAAADLAWAGPTLLPGGSWTLMPLQADLYSGTAGIALFLHQLARVTDDATHRGWAAAATATFQAQVRRSAGRLGGGLSGAGGVLYAMAHLHAARPDRSWPDLAADVLDGLRATVGEDICHDVIAGNAGSIAGLLAWRQVDRHAPIPDLLRACADRLADQAIEQPVGVRWRARPPFDWQSFVGFAHGVSGTAWALAKAAAVLDEERFSELAGAALAYERTVPDQRVSWCYGATGVGLARLSLLQDASADLADGARADLDQALRAVVERGFGGNFSLCHGDLGSLDLLLLAAGGVGGELVGTDLVRRHAVGVLDRMDELGYRCGLADGEESPSLMIGLAGLGYGLLRVADPVGTPSLLAFEPPAG